MCVVAWPKSYLVKMLGPMHKDCLSSKSEANLSNLMKERKKEKREKGSKGGRGKKKQGKQGGRRRKGKKKFLADTLLTHTKLAVTLNSQVLSVRLHSSSYLPPPGFFTLG